MERPQPTFSFYAFNVYDWARVYYRLVQDKPDAVLDNHIPKLVVTRLSLCKVDSVGLSPRR